MSRFEYLKRDFVKIYDLLSELEQNINNREFSFFNVGTNVLIKIIDKLVPNKYEDIREAIDATDDYHRSLEKLDKVLNFSNNNIKIWNNICTTLKHLYEIKKNNDIELRNDLLNGIYFFLLDIPEFKNIYKKWNIYKKSNVYNNHLEEKKFNLFLDENFKMKWNKFLLNPYWKSLKNKVSAFIATYVFGMEDSEFETCTIVKESDDFGAIFYNTTNNIDEYALNFIYDPEKEIENNNIYNAITEIFNNKDLVSFVVENILDKNNEITLNLFISKDFINKKNSIKFNNKDVNIKHYVLSDLSDFIEENEENISKRMRNAKLKIAENGYFEITGKNFKTHFSTIQASSLRDLYISSKKLDITLFDRNVREYIKELKVDKSLIETIENEMDNFLVYNNGLTVVTNKVNKKGDELFFDEIFIVNGGQTTTVIGETSSAISLNDMKVFCKIIEFDFYSQNAEEFIENISINSNNQKQIKNIDYLSTYKGLKKFEFYFNNIDDEVKLLIKRSQKKKMEYKEKGYIVLDTLNLLQIIHSTIYKNPAGAKNSPASLIKDFEKVKELFDKLDLENVNKYNFFVDLIYIFNILHYFVNNSRKIEEWYGDYRSDLAPHCLYFLLYIVIDLLAFKKNIKIENLDSFLISKNEKIIDYIKNILEIIFPIIEKYKNEISASYNTILKSRKHIEELINEIKNDEYFNKIKNYSHKYFK